MLIAIIILLVAIITAFGMLAFRAWELRTERIEMPVSEDHKVTELSFRQIERNMLYLTKHIVQWMVLFTVRHWFITATKTRKLIEDKWPKVHEFFQKKPSVNPSRPSFIKRAVVESKIKIRRIKERVKREHEAKIAEKEEQ